MIDEHDDIGGEKHVETISEILADISRQLDLPEGWSVEFNTEPVSILPPEEPPLDPSEAT